MSSSLYPSSTHPVSIKSDNVPLLCLVFYYCYFCCCCFPCERQQGRSLHYFTFTNQAIILHRQGSLFGRNTVSNVANQYPELRSTLLSTIKRSVCSYCSPPRIALLFIYFTKIAAFLRLCSGRRTSSDDQKSRSVVVCLLQTKQRDGGGEGEGGGSVGVARKQIKTDP